MTWLTALLPVRDGVAVYAALTRAADNARSQGDERGKGQLMADLLVPAAVDAVATGTGVGVDLGLVMSDSALFGTSDDLAQLSGYGPIPTELAREIVVEALSADEHVWVRRLFTHPESGELITAESRVRLFCGSMARFIRLRDQICRTPWCDAPIRQGDHALARAEKGATALSNSQGLCQGCNLAKEAPGWSARAAPGVDGKHAITTTLPTGHRYTTRPPSLATIRPVPVRVEIDYVLSA